MTNWPAVIALCGLGIVLVWCIVTLAFGRKKRPRWPFGDTHDENL